MRSDDGALKKMVRRKRWVEGGGGSQGYFNVVRVGCLFFFKEVEEKFFFSKVLLDVLKLLCRKENFQKSGIISKI